MKLPVWTPDDSRGRRLSENNTEEKTVAAPSKSVMFPHSRPKTDVPDEKNAPNGPILK